MMKGRLSTMKRTPLYVNRLDSIEFVPSDGISRFF